MSANDSIRGHLNSLVGKTIRTITGRSNRVLAVEAESVIVGTGRSPEGQAVPIDEIESAYERLMLDGEIEINPDSVGHRSAFVGAVLASLPSTESATRPARIRLREDRAPRRRNPAWAFDELILALDLYKRRGLLDDTDPDVQELSRVLNALPVHRERGDWGTFRNPNGVAMKLANLARFDRNYAGRGLRRGAKRDEEVWNRFDGRDAELRALATQIRVGVRTGQGLPSVDADAPEVEEAKAEAGAATNPDLPPPRRSSAAERRAIELRAMEVAEDHYRVAGWEVEDVSASMSFDLRCRKDGSELHVEVKGTTTNRPQVVLTANEVLHAREEHPRTALVWVNEIVLDRTGDDPVASGGSIRVIEPWRIDDGTMEALAFAYTLPAE